MSTKTIIDKYEPSRCVIAKSYEGYDISKFTGDCYFEGSGEEELVDALKESNLTNKIQDSTVVAFRVFPNKKHYNKETKKYEIVPRENPDVNVFFNIKAAESEKYEAIGNEEVKSVITQYTPELIKRKCNGFATIINWNAINVMAKIGYPCPSTNTQLDLFSDLESITERLGFTIDEDEKATIQRINGGKSTDRSISAVMIYDNDFEIVLMSSIEYQKNDEKVICRFLPQVEAYLFITNKKMTEDEFNVKSLVFNKIVRVLNSKYNECISLDNFNDIFKAIDINSGNVYTMKIKDKPKEEEKTEKKEKKARKTKEGKAAEMVAEASAEMVKEASKADKKAKEEKAATETPEKSGDEVELN